MTVRFLPHVLGDLTVANRNHAMGVRRNVGFVGDDDDGVAGLVQPGEQRHDLDAGLRVEVAGRFVGEQNRRVVDQGPGDRNPLALTA